MLWRRILLALPDVDSIPTNVLDRAGRIARGLQAEVELFYCVYEPDIVQPSLHRGSLEERIAGRVDEEHRRLENVADTLREQGLTVRCSVRWDYPVYEAVVRQVLRHQPDLLIVPAIPTGGTAPRTLAYREARLIEACPCPLLLLKTTDVYPKGSVVAAVDPLHAYEIPQELDANIIAAAKTIAYALADAPVRVFHAVKPWPQSRSGKALETTSVSEQVAQHASREARVQELALHHNIRSDHVHVELGAVETSLPHFARTMRAEAVVMGAMSRTFPERAVFGHTAEKVLGALDCDVLVIKPRGFRCPVSPEATPAVPRPPLAS